MTGPVVFEGSILARGPVTGVGRSFLTTLRAYAEIASRGPLTRLFSRDTHARQRSG